MNDSEDPAKYYSFKMHPCRVKGQSIKKNQTQNDPTSTIGIEIAQQCLVSHLDFNPTQ